MLADTVWGLPGGSKAHSLRGLLPILLLGEQRRDGCEQFA